MTVALQQGYPIDPVKYKSDSDYIEEIRKMSEEAHGNLSVREEITLLRTHLQEVEKLWREAGPGGLTMKGAQGSLPMTDDVKVDMLVKLANSISKLSRDTYIITESDYVEISECKAWLWSIWVAIQKNIKKVITGELNVNDLEAAIQSEMRQIVMPRTGRKK